MLTNSRSVRAGVIVLLLTVFHIAVYLNPNQRLSELWDWLVFNPTAAVFLLCYMLSAHLLVAFTKIHWSKAYYALGLPFGLFLAATALVGVAQNTLDGSTDWTISMAIAYAGIFYGGAISAIGYFCLPANSNEIKVEALNIPKFICVLLPWILADIWAKSDSVGLEAFFWPEFYLLIFSLFSMFLVFKEKRTPKNLAGMAFCLALGSLLTCLFLSTVNGKMGVFELTVGNFGLYYGLYAYIFIYFFSFLKPVNSDSIDVGKANWHWVELTGFLIFMCFAPITLREELVAQQDEKSKVLEMRLIDDRFSSMEERLSALEEN